MNANHDDIDPGATHVLVCGDFNSFTEADVEEIEEAYRQAGLMRVSEGSGYTIVKYGFELSSDHIFAKGFRLEEAGKMAEQQQATTCQFGSP